MPTITVKITYPECGCAMEAEDVRAALYNHEWVLHTVREIVSPSELEKRDYCISFAEDGSVVGITVAGVS
tara:strand:+ start:4405 stop:4614 length:210 start_codon:yes stop_codon:yes gene_type:complete